MAKKGEKVYMPMGIGGLTRYSEEGKELIKIKPKHVVWFAVGVVALEIMLKLFF